jgi:cytochrome c556
MNTQRILIWASLVVLGVASTLAAWGQQPSRERNPFMRQKLVNAQQVLDGIAVSNFNSIEEGAENLVRLSKKAEFRLGHIPDYDRYSDDFRRAAETLVRSARDKNLDGATLAYLDLTLNCVKCHKHIREAK